MTSPLTILAALLLLVTVGLSLSDPIPQNLSYHDYGDCRAYLGVPYFWNVVSNLPFVFIGVYGLRQCYRHWSRRPLGIARWIPLVLSVGIFITGFGSAYYHLNPCNDTLVWDRLPMTLMFMSLFSLLMFDYLGPRAGAIAFYLSLPLGIGSVLYWHFTEAAGHGDLRPYVLVQYFPMLVIPVLLLCFPRKVPYVKYILLILGWYILAKIFEHSDKVIFETLGFWSGHTIKHLLASVALIYGVKLVDGWYTEKVEHGITPAQVID